MLSSPEAAIIEDTVLVKNLNYAKDIGLSANNCCSLLLGLSLNLLK